MYFVILDDFGPSAAGDHEPRISSCERLLCTPLLLVSHDNAAHIQADSGGSLKGSRQLGI